MTQQYLRKASLLIGTGSEALDLSEMQFVFQTEARTIHTPCSVQLRIYNLSSRKGNSTAQKIAKEGVDIQLSAGYEGNFGPIFQGQIVQVRLGRENATDTYVDITGVDGDAYYNFNVTNVSVAAGTTVIGRIGAIAKAAGMKLGTIKIPNDGSKLHRGRTYFGLARDHLDGLCGTIGADWNIHNGELEVISRSAYKDGDIPTLTAATGMIGVPEQTLEGIAIRVLLNPNLEQNMAVRIDNASIQQFQYPFDYKGVAGIGFIPPVSNDGLYKVLYVSHNGDTRGQNWYTDLVCYEGPKITNVETQGIYQVPKIPY
ncbi:MAG: hypothetical protein EPN46_02470 [Candidimonas sp.]|nr:MAG: hypothetical protein EPN77_05350 [Candidimonas sp.]TAM22309.1 MAG: hypothetical protein EPN62_12320 [Candidimonas sp.]TAM80197.1 MAG: hypothetical protein EPN46_02470 [Candidimonas sp.]